MLWAAGEAFPREAPLQLDTGQYDSPRPVRYVVGCCILLNCAALEQVGLFDEAYFMMHEEKDWCTRAVRAGFQNWYIPAATAWHDLEHTFTSQGSPRYHYLYVRNNLYYWQKGTTDVKGWQRLRQSLAYVWQEIIFIRHHGKQPVLSARAAGRGALDFLAGRLGPPPQGL